MEQLAKKLNITEPEGWYTITRQSLQQHGAYGLLQKYNGSLIKLLKAIYPQYKWDITKFNQLPRGYWNDIDNQRAFMAQLAKTLNITHTKDWFRLTATTLMQHGGSRLLQKYGSLSKLLVNVCPDYRQLCRDFVMNLVQNSGLSRVEDVFQLPLQHP